MGSTPVLMFIGLDGIGSISSRAFSPSIGRMGSTLVLMLIGLDGMGDI
jgi:hypothetical protein